MSELKPCPFCENNLIRIIYPNNSLDFSKRIDKATIFCDKCGSFIQHQALVKAMNLWNTRPLEDVLTAENEQLKAKVSELDLISSMFENVGIPKKFRKQGIVGGIKALKDAYCLALATIKNIKQSRLELFHSDDVCLDIAYEQCDSFLRDGYFDMKRAFNKLEADNQRMREALEWIVSHPSLCTFSVQQKAEEALKGGE